MASTDRILEAARGEFAQHGYAARLQDIAERAVKALGFPVLRVRHHGIMGRLEVDAADLDRALADADRITAAIKGAGYRHAVIDPEPFRSGRLNAALVRPAASR